MAEHIKPLFVSPDGAVKLTGVGRSKIYELINSGVLTRRKDGARTLLKVAEIEAWFESLPVGVGAAPKRSKKGRQDVR